MTPEQWERHASELAALQAQGDALTERARELSVVVDELEDLQVAYARETRERITQQDRADQAERERDALRAERDVLRGVGCEEAKTDEEASGPCGVCVKCLKARAEQAERERDEALARAEQAEALSVERANAIVDTFRILYDRVFRSDDVLIAALKQSEQERDALRAALAKVRAHTAWRVPEHCTVETLLKGLLASIERIADDVLTPTKEEAPNAPR